MQNNDHPAAQQQQQQQPSTSAFVHRVYIILMLLSLNISQTIENHHGLERVCLCARAEQGTKKIELRSGFYSSFV